MNIILPNRTYPEISLPTNAGGRISIVFSPSTLALIAANLVPLVGVLIFQWEPFSILVLYLAESWIIGFFGALKTRDWIFIKKFVPWIIVDFFLLFFAFSFLSQTFSLSAYAAAIQTTLPYVVPAVASLAASHGFSYIRNFLGKQENLRMSATEQMHNALYRTSILRFAIVFGGFTLGGIAREFNGRGSMLPAAVALIFLKTLVDAIAHTQEHSQKEAALDH